MYELSVTRPVAKTWYLAGMDIDADELYPGSPAFQGIVEADAPVESGSVLGGASDGGRVTLVLRDHLGSYRGAGAYRRFSDQFAEKVPGHDEPYDLDTAVLVAKLTWTGLAEEDVLTLGRWCVVTGSKRIAEGRFTLDFESDPRFLRPLPRRRITATLWPMAPAESIGRPITLAFGSGVRLPALLVEPTQFGNTYLVCESPVGTPITSIDEVFVVDANPTSNIAEHVPVVSGGSQSGVGSAGSGTIVFGALAGPTHAHQMARTLYLTENRFLTTVSLSLKRSAAGGTINGRGIVRIETDSGSFSPSGTLAHPDATALDTGFPSGTSFGDFFFNFAIPVLLRKNTLYWVVTEYVPVDGTVDDRTILLDSHGTDTTAPVTGARIRRNSDGPWQVFGTAGATSGNFEFTATFGSYTKNTTRADAAGNQVAVVEFPLSMDLRGREITASLTAMRDDSGTYTGTPANLIDNGADIARFLMLAPIALGLDAARVDLAGLTAARTQLGGWFALAGVVADDADGVTWLQRVARCVKGAVYETQAGALTLAIDGAASGTLVRSVGYWEHGSLELGAHPESVGQPWTLVEVYAGRNLVAITAPENPGAQIIAEWPIHHRHQASDDLVDRYSIRTNGGQTESVAERFVASPTEANTFYFANTDAAAAMILDWLVSIGAKRLDPWGVVTVELPRFALSWRLFDEIDLESQAFPSALDHAVIGQVHWAGTTWLDNTEWYQCRRGRFSVRGLVIKPSSGAEFPVIATLKLIAWETD